MRAPAAPLRLPPPSVLPRLQRRPPVAPPVRLPWFRRWFGRREPTVYQRCLAVHIHFAGPRSSLS